MYITRQPLAYPKTDAWVQNVPVSFATCVTLARFLTFLHLSVLICKDSYHKFVEMNKCTYVKCLEQCLPHNKHSEKCCYDAYSTYLWNNLINDK